METSKEKQFNITEKRKNDIFEHVENIMKDYNNEELNYFSFVVNELRKAQIDNKLIMDAINTFKEIGLGDVESKVFKNEFS